METKNMMLGLHHHAWMTVGKLFSPYTEHYVILFCLSLVFFSNLCPGLFFAYYIRCFSCGFRSQAVASVVVHPLRPRNKYPRFYWGKLLLSTEIGCGTGWLSEKKDQFIVTTHIQTDAQTQTHTNTRQHAHTNTNQHGQHGQEEQKKNKQNQCWCFFCRLHVVDTEFCANGKVTN